MLEPFQIIKSEWTDYNNHLNMAYYVLIFDVAWEVMLKKFNMGEQSAKTSGMSTMVVETNTTYDNEIKEGDQVEILLTFFDHDKKRLHFKLEMIEKKTNTLNIISAEVAPSLPMARVYYFRELNCNNVELAWDIDRVIENLNTLSVMIYQELTTDIQGNPN